MSGDRLVAKAPFVCHGLSAQPEGNSHRLTNLTDPRPHVVLTFVNHEELRDPVRTLLVLAARSIHSLCTISDVYNVNTIRNMEQYLEGQC